MLQKKENWKTSSQTKKKKRSKMNNQIFLLKHLELLRKKLILIRSWHRMGSIFVLITKKLNSCHYECTLQFTFYLFVANDDTQWSIWIMTKYHRWYTTLWMRYDDSVFQI